MKRTLVLMAGFALVLLQVIQVDAAPPLPHPGRAEESRAVLYFDRGPR